MNIKNVSSPSGNYGLKFVFKILVSLIFLSMKQTFCCTRNIFSLTLKQFQ